jgi:hypothetical protein
MRWLPSLLFRRGLAVRVRLLLEGAEEETDERG